MMNNRNLIYLDNIVKTFEHNQIVFEILKGVSLTIHEGDLLAILGASGSGKSTLMNIIGLLDKATSGQYYLQQSPINWEDDNYLAHLRNQRIGFVFQQFNLLPRLTVRQNVALPLTYRHLPTAEIEKAVAEALRRVSMLDYIDRRPMQLSGGQQQRVAIARALVGEPSLILADEPTGALDSQTSAEIMALFLALHREGRTLLIVTHDKDVAAQCARRITIADGQIIHEE